MIAAAFAALALISTPEPEVVPPEVAADLQCIGVLAMHLDNDMSELARQKLLGNMMYYLGRLEGRDPGTDWVAAMERYSRETDFEVFDRQNRRCGEELSSMERRIELLGQ